MNDFVLDGCSLPALFLKGRRIPSTADEVFTDIRSPLFALAGDLRKRFDLESFMRQVYVIAFGLAIGHEKSVL